MPSKLNGWQRLWVVGLILWGLICATATYLLLPKTTPQLVHEWAEKKVELMKQYHGGSKSMADFKTRVYGNSSDDEIVHPRSVSGQKFDANSAVPANEIEAIDSRYQAEIGSNPSRWSAIGKAVLIWLVPSALVYSFGIAIGWIRAGFIKEDRDA